MNETSEAAAVQQQQQQDSSFSQIERQQQQLESRQAATQELAQPVDTWAQLAPQIGPAEMQGGGGGGWALHVWQGQQADNNSAASFFDQPLQSADNAITAHAEFFDSPQVQQSQAVQWSATDSAHSLQHQDQLRSRVVAADKLATSNDQLTATNHQLTAINQQLTAANDQLTASNHQLAISSSQFE